ncbi:MAG: chromophore lyase CpcT/CpeT [Flammeovirgaceae bacterium]
MKRFFITILILSSYFCLQAQSASKASLKKLANYMIGSYNSAAQAAQDTAYFDISLEMCRIWKKEKGSIWLYVEQAVSANKDKPYRQRVYQLQQVDATTLSSTIYSVPDATQAIGAYKEKKPLAYWKPADLTLLKGCTIYLKYQGKKFIGETKEGACTNSWGKAAYATSEVIIDKNQLMSWDRGWNTDKEQVWGAVKGGYVFDKVK